MVLIKFISRSFGCICFFFSFFYSSFAQDNYPQAYFEAPLKIPLALSGNFGELRNNHFHSGLDFKTDSVIGKEVVASADGYVSRIKVSASGFGKALYLTHPNGYVTVYGHLHRFVNSINSYVEKDQYEKESFETELFPDSNQFMVKKGSLIGWSGNTGGSEGPHLHFEIRNAKTEMPINPMLFGIEIRDTIKPVIESILVRNETEQREPSGNGIPSEIIFRLGNNTNDTIEISGSYFLEFSGYDLANGEPNHLGIYHIQMLIDDSMVYSITQSTFSFNETRYINAHINYKWKMENGNIFERCYSLPGDSFSLNLHNKQIIQDLLFSGQTRLITFILKDFNNNITKKQVFLKGTDKTERKAESKDQKYGKFSNEAEILRLKFGSVNHIVTPSMYIEIPDRALYQDEWIEYLSENHQKPLFHEQKLHHLIGSIPFHHPYNLSLKEPAFPVMLRRKACIVQLAEKNKMNYIGGEFRGDSITVKTRVTGTFMVYFDTIAPEIGQYEISCDSIFGYEILRVSISDELSGISSYRATLDGKWILMEYDEKNKLLNFPINSLGSVLNKSFMLVVSDKKGNQSIYKCLIQ